MLGSPALEVAIGLAFVFTLLSLVCTTVMEWIAGRQKRRPLWLKTALHKLLADDSLYERFYQHGMIKSMSLGGGEPSYLSSRTFALTMMDLMKQDAGAGQAEPDWERRAVLKLPPQLAEALRTTVGDARLSVQDSLESWFDDAMERVSGAYKRRIQRNTLVLAALITIFANADTFGMARRLWRDPILRAKVVTAAEARAQKAPPPPAWEYTDPDSPAVSEPTPEASQKPPEVAGEGGLSDEENALLADLTGWSKDFATFGRVRRESGMGAAIRAILLAIVMHLPGWLLTTIAVSLGAPFWFDLLNKFVNIRAAGKSPAEKEAEQAKASRP